MSRLLLGEHLVLGERDQPAGLRAFSPSRSNMLDGRLPGLAFGAAGSGSSVPQRQRVGLGQRFALRAFSGTNSMKSTARSASPGAAAGETSAADGTLQSQRPGRGIDDRDLAVGRACRSIPSPSCCRYAGSRRSRCSSRAARVRRTRRGSGCPLRSAAIRPARFSRAALARSGGRSRARRTGIPETRRNHGARRGEAEPTTPRSGRRPSHIGRILASPKCLALDVGGHGRKRPSLPCFADRRVRTSFPACEGLPRRRRRAWSAAPRLERGVSRSRGSTWRRSAPRARRRPSGRPTGAGPRIRARVPGSRFF